MIAGMTDHHRTTTFPDTGLPLLLPEIPLAWRDCSTVQVGIDEHQGRLLFNIGPREWRAMRALDGTRRLARTLSDFAAEGGDPLWLAAVINDLHHCGALVDAEPTLGAPEPRAELARLSPEIATLAALHPGRAHDIMRRRRDAEVVVRGTGRVGVGIATLLASAGIGTVRITTIAGDCPRVLPRTISPLGPTAVSLGAPARSAARDTLSRAAFAVRTRRSGSGRRPDLVLVCPPRVVPPEISDALSTVAWPHLTVISDGPTARVGPLVLPGRTACLRCLELHRADRDPAWPAVLTQVAHHRGAHRSATNTVLGTLAASMAALHALQVLDGQSSTPPPSAGAILELRLPELQWRRRSWTAHPDCGCTWSPDLRPAA